MPVEKLILIAMNFEELLNQKNTSIAGAQPVMLGKLARRRGDDKKYFTEVVLRRELADATGFVKAMEAEASLCERLQHKQQLHFYVDHDDSGITSARIGQGNYTTVAQMISDNPAVVATKDFVKNMIERLVDITSYLNDQGICHLCFAPDNIFVKRNFDIPLLLLHGSAYLHLAEHKLMWKDHEQYVAPEVLDGGSCSPASDVYSLGRFIEYVYQQGSVPFELRSIVKKATAANADDRYQSAAELKAALDRRASTLRWGKVAAAVVVACLLGWAVYSTMSPKKQAMDYLAPAPKENPDSTLDKGFDEQMEMVLLGSDSPDSTVAPGQLPAKQEEQLREQQAKGEEIFRRQYTKQAERILGRLYGRSRLTMTQEDFVRLSTTATEELVRAQQELGEMTGLSTARCNLLASDIVEQVTNRLEARQRKAMLQEEQELRKRNEERLKGDRLNQTIHEAIAPGKAEQPKSRTNVDQKKAIEVEEELKELSK